MARMPQIPQPELSGRPGGRLSGAEGPQPDINAIEAPLEAGAKLGEGVGDQLERLQAKRDTVQKQRQDIEDEAKAVRAQGAHADRLSGLAEQFRTQYIDNPRAAVAAMRDAAYQETDTAVKGAPTAGAQFKMMPMLERTNNDAIKGLDNWALHQGVQNAKNDLADKTHSATHGLEAIPTAAMLKSRIENVFQADGGALLRMQKQLTPNPQKAQRDLVKSMTEAWVEQRSAVSGQSALDMIAELKNPSSWIKGVLEPHEIQRQLKLAKAAFDGAQETANFNMFAAHNRQLSTLTDLIKANDPKFPQVGYAQRTATLRQMEAVEKDPALGEDSKKLAREGGQKLLNSIDAAQSIFRKQRGLEQTKADEAVRQKLLTRATKFFTNGPTAIAQHYEQALALRHDAIEALDKGQISFQTFDLFESSLKPGLKARDARELENVGTPGWFSSQSPRQAGNATLQSFFKGKYSKATDEQKNDAVEGYMQQLLDASTAGRNIDKVSAHKMAADAVEFAMREKHGR